MAETGSAVFRAVADFSALTREAGTAATALDKVKTKAGEIGPASKTGTDEGGTHVKTFGEKVSGLADKAETTGKKMSLGLTLPILGAGGLALKTFADFDLSITKVGATSGATTQEIEAMRAKALQLGADTMFSGQQAADAMYELSTAGVKTRDILGTVTDATLLLAQATGADMPTAAALVSQSMNAFSLDASQAGHIADVMAQAMNTSALDVTGLAQALANAGSLGASAGQKLESVVAGVSVLVNQGVPAASAGVAIRQAIDSLAAPASEKAANLMKGLGLEVRDSTGHMKQFPEIVAEMQAKLSTANPEFMRMVGTQKDVKAGIELLNTSLNNQKQVVTDLTAKYGASSPQVAKAQQQVLDIETALNDARKTGKLSIEARAIAEKDAALNQLFGVEGMKAMNLAMNVNVSLNKDVAADQQQIAILTEKMGAEWVNARMKLGTFTASGADAVKALAVLNENADGTAKTFAEKLGDTPAAKMDALKGSIETAAISFMSTLAPGITFTVEKLTGLINAIGEFAAKHPALTKLFGAFAVFLAVLGPTLIITAKLVNAFQTVQKAVKAMNLALKGTQAAPGILSKLGGALKAVGGAAKVAAQAVGKAMLAMGRAILANPWILALVAVIALIVLVVKHWDTIKEVVTKVWDWVYEKVSGVVSAVVDFIKKWWPLLLAILVGPIGVAVLAIVKNWDTIKNAFKAAVEFIGEWLGKMLEWFKDLPGKIFGFADKIWDFLWEQMASAAGWIKDRVEDIIGFYVSLPGRIWNAASGLFQFLIDKMTAAKDWIWNRVEDIVGFYVSLPGRLLAAAGNVFQWLMDKMSDAKDWIWNRVQDIFGFIRDLPGRLANVASGIWDFFYDSFKGAWNQIARFVRGLDFTIDVPDILPGPDEYTIGFPDLPLLHGGGPVGGRGPDVAALLQPGEYVMQRSAVQSLGVDLLNGMNRGQMPGGGGGVTIEKIEINNPVGETAPDSLTRSMQKLEFAGYFG